MRTKWQRREAGAGLLFLLPSLAGFLVFSLVPFVIMIGKSFTQGVGRIRFVGLANYTDLLSNDVFLLAAKNTLRFEAVCVPLICILSFFIALGLQKIPKFWLRAAIILPLVIPAASVSMIFHILVADGGTAQKFLALFGMEEASILHSPAAFYALVVFYLWKNIGYTVILFLAGLNAIPREYSQAASIDGANGAQILRYITIPRIAPTAFLVFIIAIIRTFSSFREAYLLAGNYPHTSIYMLQHFMQNNFAALNYQRLSVAALLVFAVIFLLVWVIYRLRNRMED